jgi:hypothetical protein
MFSPSTSPGKKPRYQIIRLRAFRFLGGSGETIPTEKSRPVYQYFLLQHITTAPDLFSCNLEVIVVSVR